jgi:gas vesicle protein
MANGNNGFKSWTLPIILFIMGTVVIGGFTTMTGYVVANDRKREECDKQILKIAEEHSQTRKKEMMQQILDVRQEVKEDVKQVRDDIKELKRVQKEDVHQLRVQQNLIQAQQSQMAVDIGKILTMLKQNVD